MSLRLKIGLTVFYHALLSACLFPQRECSSRNVNRPLVWGKGNVDAVAMLVNINTLMLLVILFVPSVLLVTAEQNCMETLNERCTTPYQRTVEAIETDNPAICTALAIYLRCVKDVKKNVKSCGSNLYFHTISTLIPRLTKDRNCGNVSLPINKTVLNTTATTGPVTSQPACLNFSHEQITPLSGEIKQDRYQYRLCALFGDPHLKTFTEERQTCVVKGAWPLIENEYFSVQVSNVPLVSGSSATATNTVSIIALFFT